MAGNAPVCHVPTDQVVFDQPKPVKMPSIPTPVDLPSAIAAINALKLIVQMLAGQQSARGSQGSRGFPGFPGQAVAAGGSSNTSNTNKTPPKVGRWVEVPGTRVVETKRIFHTNPDGTTDKDQFVDVKRINKLTFQDTVTGEIWVWSR